MSSVDPIELSAIVAETRTLNARVRDALDGMSPPLNDEELNFMLDVQDIVLLLANDIDDAIMDDEEQMSQVWDGKPVVIDTIFDDEPVLSARS